MQTLVESCASLFDVAAAGILLVDGRGELDRSDVRTAQAFTAVATVGILYERALREGKAIRDQLAAAPELRVVIEQAKGVLAHTHGATMDEAFSLLRGYARSHGQKLSVVANDIVTLGLRIRLHYRHRQHPASEPPEWVARFHSRG